MNDSNMTVTVSFQPWDAEPFVVTDGLASDLFFVAQPPDLDYDDPNAVVSSEQTEFVAMTDAMRCVDMVVTTAQPQQQRPQPEIDRIIQRTAA
jgi:hypothetical protein